MSRLPETTGLELALHERPPPEPVGAALSWMLLPVIVGDEPTKWMPPVVSAVLKLIWLLLMVGNALLTTLSPPPLPVSAWFELITLFLIVGLVVPPVMLSPPPFRLAVLLVTELLLMLAFDAARMKRPPPEPTVELLEMTLLVIVASEALSR